MFKTSPVRPQYLQRLISVDLNAGSWPHIAYPDGRILALCWTTRRAARLSAERVGDGATYTPRPPPCLVEICRQGLASSNRSCKAPPALAGGAGMRLRAGHARWRTSGMPAGPKRTSGKPLPAVTLRPASELERVPRSPTPEADDPSPAAWCETSASTRIVGTWGHR